MNLPIYSEQAFVGIIDVEESGPRLLYQEAWVQSADAFPISLTMPLSSQTWGSELVTPWLMNLLPEGEPLRAMTQALGVARDDIMGLIAEIGRDIAGALTIGVPRPMETPGYKPIVEPEHLERIIDELPSKPFLVGEDGVSMSLAGAQEKLPLAMLGGKLAIPINGASSTHILKPDNPRLVGSVQNEALCMILARRCDLTVPVVTTGVAGKRNYLLVTRYDREVTNASVRRLHQEDFCQALGRPPVAKYQHNRSSTRGPSLAEMFSLVRTHMTARDINRLLDAVIFNIAIGNVDSHAKNYSILLRPRQSELAPHYDLMSGLVWANITQNHAQDVGGQRRGNHIYARHWRRMAEECGLAGPATVRRVNRLVSRILAELPAAVEEVAAMPAGHGDMLQIFAEAVRERAQLVRAHSAQEDESHLQSEQTIRPVVS